MPPPLKPAANLGNRRRYQKPAPRRAAPARHPKITRPRLLIRFLSKANFKPRPMPMSRAIMPRRLSQVPPIFSSQFSIPLKRWAYFQGLPACFSLTSGFWPASGLAAKFSSPARVVLVGPAGTGFWTWSPSWASSLTILASRRETSWRSFSNSFSSISGPSLSSPQACYGLNQIFKFIILYQASGVKGNHQN